jgi:hypothetical protein
VVKDQLGCEEDIKVATCIGWWQIPGKEFFIASYFGLAFVELIRQRGYVRDGHFDG